MKRDEGREVEQEPRPSIPKCNAATPLHEVPRIALAEAGGAEGHQKLYEVHAVKRESECKVWGVAAVVADGEQICERNDLDEDRETHHESHQQPCARVRQPQQAAATLYPDGTAIKLCHFLSWSASRWDGNDVRA